MIRTVLACRIIGLAILVPLAFGITVAGGDARIDGLCLVQARASRQPGLDPAEIDEEHFKQEGGDMTTPDTYWQDTSGCIEDMCSDFDLSMAHVDTGAIVDTLGDLDLNLPAVLSGCAKSEDASSRLLISAVVQGYHGSTALEEVLMSSDKVATLCSCGSWQCEANCVEGLARPLDAWSYNYNEILSILGKCWDLERPVLFQKFIMPDYCTSNVSKEVYDRVGNHCQSQALMQFETQMSHAPIPGSWPGVQFLNRVYLFLWRPLCLTTLSTHAKSEIERGQKVNHMEMEVHLLAETVETHKLLNGNRPVLVISLASLIWETARTKNRIQAWMPCVGELSMNYVPELNKDIFPDNRFKADGSVEAFGRAIDPASLSYNVETRECSDHALLDGLGDVLLTSSQDATRYLTNLS